jgi:hypothetical protein
VTDTGIEDLCHGLKCLKPLVVKNGTQNELCMTLRRLVMPCTGVTKKGVHIALQNFFVLESLEHEMIFAVIVEICQAAIDQLMLDNSNLYIGRLCLKDFNSSRRNNLGQVITQLCPSLLHLWITEKELKNPDFLPFACHLKKLREFLLNSTEANDVQEITFYSHLVPLLEVIGKSLENLAVPNVDIWVIIKLCPNLIALDFTNHFDSINGTSIKNEGEINLEIDRFPIMEKNHLILKKLEKLYCRCNVSREILDFFLSYPLLVNLWLFRCDIVTDDFLKETRLQNIEEIMLFLCDQVTIEGITELMIDQNSLKSITFVYCKNVTLKDITNLRTLADRKMWDISLGYKNHESYDLTPIHNINHF